MFLTLNYGNAEVVLRNNLKLEDSLIQIVRHD